MLELPREVRWRVKKLARRACVHGAGLLPGPCRGVRVLTYHRFADAPRDPFAVTPDAFLHQMQWVREQGIAVNLSAVLDFTAGRRPLSDGSVLITIDDGFASLHDVALPILHECRIPAVAFLPAGLIDRPMTALDPEPRLTWEQTRELIAYGVEIGSHGWSHRSLGTMSERNARDEAKRSRSVLEEETGQPVRAFAYPYGTRADFSAATHEVLRQAGYRCAFTAQHGAIAVNADPHQLSRVKVEGGEPFATFIGLCRGGLDAWRLVDRYLWALQD